MTLKAYITFFLIGLVATSVFSQIENVERFYDSGEVRTTGLKVNGKRSGDWVDYYETGEIKRTYSFTNGKQDKESKGFYIDGKVEYETFLFKGEHIYMSYFENGKIFIERALGTGYYKEFYETGKIKVKTNYIDNEISGLWEFYYDTGELNWEVEYVNSYKKGFYKEYYKNGQLKTVGQHKADKKNGKEKRFSVNGILLWEGNYTNDIFDKKWQQYDVNGGKLNTFKFKQGFIGKSDKVPELIETVIPEGVYEKSPVHPECAEILGENAKRKCFTTQISQFIAKKFNTDLASKKGLSGTHKIYVFFKIDKEGNIVNIKARSDYKFLEDEAKRVVELLPRMIPGEQRGKKVRVPFTLPITFVVN